MKRILFIISFAIIALSGFSQGRVVQLGQNRLQYYYPVLKVDSLYLGQSDSAAVSGGFLFLDYATKKVKLGSLTSGISGTGTFSSKIRVSDNADITVASDDYTIVLKNSTTNKNVTLPSAASSTNRVLRFINTGTSTFTFSISVRTNASTTFTVSTAIYSIEIQSDGTDWWLINNYLR